MKNRHTIRLLAFFLLQHALCLCVQAQGTAITYQGRLTDGTSAAAGSYDFRFTAYDAGTAGSPIGTVVTTNAVALSNGVFTVTLNFGTGVFTGPGRWLQIEVKTNGAPSYVILTPRQPLMPSPYAIYTPNAGSATTATSAGSATTASTATLANSVAAGSITSASLAPGSVTAAAIAPGAVSSLGASDGSPTNALVVNTNGLVGIGTNAPGAVLEISGGANIVTPQVLFERRDESDGYTNLFGAGSVAYAGNLLAVAAAYEQGFTIVDISNPQSPILRSQFRDEEGVFGSLGIHVNQTAALAMKTNLLIVAAGNDSAVTFISLTNPASPVKLAELRDGVGGWNELRNVYAVSLSGNLLAIAGYSDDAVTLANISNPAAPIKLVEMRDGQYGFTNMAAVQAVALSGNLLAIGSYDDNAVTLVNVANPASPVKLAELRDEMNGFTGLAGVTGLALSSNLLAIASLDWDGSVTLVNVANPSNPVKLAEWHDDEAGINFLKNVESVAFSGNWLAASAWDDRAVTLFDIADPANPRLATVLRDGIAGFNSLLMPGGITFAGTNLAITSAEDRAITLASFPSVAAAGLVSQQRVGIGTAQPSEPLHVVGNVIVQDAVLFDINAKRVEFGDATATGDRSFAAGSSRTMASGSDSVAMGDWAVASGYSAIALGSGATASGSRSVALGNGATASEDSSIAIGVDTIASGTGATALGYRTVASGYASLAAGRLAQANHAGTFVWSDTQSWDDFVSTAENQFLIRANGGVGINKNNPATALDVNGTVTATGLNVNGAITASNFVGSLRLNDSDQYFREGSDILHGLGWYGGSKLFAGVNVNGPVLYGNGGGALGSRSATTNVALRWDGTGNVTLNGTLNTSGDVFLNDKNLLLRGDRNHGLGWYGAGKSFGSLSLDGPALYGYSGGVLGTMNSGSTTNVVLYWNSAGKVGIGTTSPDANLTVNGSASKPGGGSWATYSDLRLKDVVKEFTSGLADLDGIQPVQYHYKTNNPLNLPSQETYVGVVAQQVQAAIPEAVEQNQNGYLIVNNDPILWTMVNAIKELNQKVESKNAENTELKQRIERLEQLLIMKNEGAQ